MPRRRSKPSAPRFVIVHRNSAGEVLEASDPFTDEDESNAHAARMLQGINLFPGDSLHCEDDDGQATEAKNR